MSHEPLETPGVGALTIGATVGNYRIEKKIGQGGMGAVYLAQHPLLGRKAAVKVLLPEHSKRSDLVTRFFNEAKATASLRHPALVEVFDFGFLPDGSGYIVMDFLEGESLADRLARVAPLAPEVAAEIARQIAAGVGAAHGQKIVHRDLKPDNVFLIPDPEAPGRERVKILDFGIAKLVLPQEGGSKGATSTGMVLGTPLFMAPEQCRGSGQVNHRADVYSVGCILYMMLTSRPPFAYEGVGEILGAHLHEPVTPPRTFAPDVPPALEAITIKALEKKPEARHQTMSDLAGELQRFLTPNSTALGYGPASPSLATAPSLATPAPGAGTGAGRATPAPPAGRATPAATAPTTLSAAVGATEREERSLPEVPLGTGGLRRWAPVIAAVAIVAAGAGAFALLRGQPAARPPESLAIAPSPPPSAAPTPPATPPAPTLAAPPLPAPTPAPAPTPTPTAPTSPAPAPEAPAPTRAAARPTTRRSEPVARGPQRLYDEAIAHRARGDEAEALLAFRAYLHGDRLPADQRADAERQMISLQKKFGEIQIDCDLAGVAVVVDGRSYGTTPLRHGVLVRPGNHTLSMSRAGYRPLARTLSVEAGQRLPVYIKLPR